MLRGLGLACDSRCYLSTGVGMLMRNRLRKTSHDEIKKASKYQTQNGNLKNKMSYFSHLNSLRPSEHVNNSSFPPFPAKSECIKNSSDTSRILHLLEEAQEYFNKQKWTSAYSRYLNLFNLTNLHQRHEIEGNLAVCSLQSINPYCAAIHASSAASLQPSEMVYHQLTVQARVMVKSYRDALFDCERALEIGSKMLDVDESEMEELKKLKQYCTDKIYAGWEGDFMKDDDYPFREFLQGFISHDALEEIAASAKFRCYCSLCTKERRTAHAIWVKVD